MSGFFGTGVCVVSVLLFSFNLYAANPYRLGEVDYFHNKLQAQAPQEEREPFDWREPSLTADGKASYYTPPAPMLNLLENPTPDNAKAYLDWQKQKVEKIMKAQEVIDQVVKGESKQ